MSDVHTSASKEDALQLGRPLPMEVAATFVKSGLPMFD
jgi:hypothetical protein